MGGLLARLQSDPNPLEVFVDFESCKPSEGPETEIYQTVQEVLDRSEGVLTRLCEYRGCGDLIRKAINEATEDTQKEAWAGVVPMVKLLTEFFNYSHELQGVISPLLRTVCVSDDPEASLQSMQALTRQLATIFNFVLRFDDAKMTNPAIQNDLSYYRRTLNKMKTMIPDFTPPIDDNTANNLSLFYAYPTPMMRCLCDTVIAFLNQQAEEVKTNVTTSFAVMANVCYSMVATKKFTQTPTNMFCLRAMTAAIIVYDHTDKQGAFHKKSPIHTKVAISTLLDFECTNVAEKEVLVNALRFTTMHLGDDETPAATKNLLKN